MLSDYVVELMKTKRFQSHAAAMFFAFLTLGTSGQPVRAIPPEYDKVANEIFNQAAQNLLVILIPEKQFHETTMLHL